MKVKISLAIPAYNAEKFIRTVIASCLQQTETPHEILLSDDGSSDQTPQILREYAAQPLVRLVSPPQRLGIGSHYRHLVQQATGSHIVILSCDDALHPNFVKTALKGLQQQPELGMLIFSGYLCNAQMKPQSRFGLGYPRHLLTPPMGFEHFLQSCTYLISFTVWPVALLRSLPPLPDDAGLATDWYWALAVGSQSPIQFSRYPLGYYRYHDQNASHSDGDRWNKQAQTMLEFIADDVSLSQEFRESLLILQNSLKNRPLHTSSQNRLKSIQNFLKNSIQHFFANRFVGHPDFLK
ncbi:glycosyltransferase [Synechocystis sp. FACHB-383]|uniref:glycosyltransferase family 2 protein n=1 Tax=Synechocystis sp. FACHB-383 TaxID=2692864 RepID=UPI0016869AE1|nr:glycosyltransferase family A protein [Synechocystis sp. FACHB-383]MBD2654452.1 glycosyltransferase [Synechocystis sp. FACHB-383]